MREQALATADKRPPCPRLYCGRARGQIVAFEKIGSFLMERTTETSRWTRLTSSSWFKFAAGESVVPPTKLVRSALPSGARPGKSDEFQTEPRTRSPAERGTRKPKPFREWPTSFLG